MTSSPRATIEITEGIRVCCPDDIRLLTPYVLREQGDWFEDEIRFFRGLVTPQSLFIDIGANYGLYSLSAARRGARAVWAYEPCATTAAFLRASVASNGFSAVTLVQQALSDRPGAGRLSNRDNSELNALLAPDAEGGEAVELTSLDEEWARHGWGEVDLVKIDAEGHEMKVIAGGERFFRANSPLVMCEIKAGASVELGPSRRFMELGYALYRLEPGLQALVPQSLDEPIDNYQLNVFCCKPDRAALLAARGLLAPAPETPAPPAGAWEQFLGSLPYGARRMADWQRGMREQPPPDWSEYRAALDYHALAMSGIGMAQRAGALRAAFLKLQALVRRAATMPRLMSFARVAADHGERAVAVQALQFILQAARERAGEFAGTEPWLLPSAVFERGEPAPDIARWAIAAALDAFERRRMYSSYFSPPNITVGLANDMHNLGFDVPWMKRRAELAVALRNTLAADLDATFNLGAEHARAGRYQEAADCYRHVLEKRPDDAEAHMNLGGVLVSLRRYGEAMASSRRALELAPDMGLAHYNLGLAHYRQGDAGPAVESFRKAVELSPDYVEGYRALTFALINRGTGREEQWALHRRLGGLIEAPLRARWAKRDGEARDPARRLRIGYVSPDLREHSVATFLEPVLAHHDRAAFEIHCYYSNTIDDAVTARLRALADRWTPCAGLTDEEVARRIEDDGIDVLVDLAGHTVGGRTGVFARRPAPVQASWLGYPATTGLDAIGWRIVTADTDPAGEERWHSERLYRLPRSLWCYRPRESQREARHEAPQLARLGEVRFGSMNAIAKVSDRTIATWARILHAVPGSRLAMTGAGEGDAAQLLRARFAAHGIASERLVLHGRLDDEAYTALFDDIDLALDPFPYNGTTTTCETLWRGVPVVSLEGDSSVARSGFALLKLLGMESLVAKDEDRYVDLAVGLACDPARLGALRAELRPRFESSPLRDEAGFTRELENAYREMWLRA